MSVLFRRVFFGICICLLSVRLFSAEQEIVVRLAAGSQLLPLYVGQIEQKSAAFPQAHLKELHAILSFDCNYNGMTKTVARTGKLSSIPDLDSFTKPTSFQILKAAGVFYVIKLQVSDKELVCKVISVNSQTIKQIEGVALTGILAQDRLLMHRLSDSIFEVLFHKKSVATSKLVYTKRIQKKDGAGRLVWTSGLYESDYDGMNEKVLLQDGARMVTPAFQHNASTSALCYVSYKIGQPKIFFVSKQDGRARRLTPLRGNQMTPAISPDLKYIAFSCDAAGTTDLFLQPFHPQTGAIGKPRQIYTSRVSAQASPTFSPDGKHIAFASGKGGIPKVYMMDIPKEHAKIEDVHQVLIAKKCRESSAPAWSPDGKKIAYSARSSGPRQIWIYDVETKEERQLTDGPADKENPSWAQDSLHLVFNLTDAKGSELYLVNLNQPQAVRVSHGPGDKCFPVWK